MRDEKIEGNENPSHHSQKFPALAARPRHLIKPIAFGYAGQKCRQLGTLTTTLFCETAISSTSPTFIPASSANSLGKQNPRSSPHLLTLIFIGFPITKNLRLAPQYRNPKSNILKRHSNYVS
jgi:hypothetical protein